jgi:hypothetical protein
MEYQAINQHGMPHCQLLNFVIIYNSELQKWEFILYENSFSNSLPPCVVLHEFLVLFVENVGFC